MEILPGGDIQESPEIHHLKQHIVSNHLIVDQIMQHLHKEDLLGMSFVNKLWLQRARDCLNKRHNCEVILKGQACESLKALNASLQSKKNIFYNGINGDNHDLFSCFIKHDRQTWTENEIRLMYSNILKAIRFEYITFSAPVPNCPFEFLLRIIFQEKLLTLGEFRMTAIDLRAPTYIREQSIYPNLRVVDVHSQQLNDSIINYSLPNVKKIVNTHNSDWFGPKPHLLTFAKIKDSSHPFFYMMQRPRWESLDLINLKVLTDNFYNRFSWAGSSLSFTLKELHCSVGLLTNLTMIDNLPRFWTLKKLTARADTLDDPRHPSQLVQMINWDWFAPNLYKISWRGIREHQPFIMEVDAVEHQFQSSSARKLRFWNPEVNIFAKIFPNITFITLWSRHVCEMFEQPLLFPNLERLRIDHLDTLSRLEFLFGIHEDELEEIGKLSIEDCQNLCIVPGPKSILNRRDLKRISLDWGLPNKLLPFPTTVLSTGAGVLLCSKFPGLCLDLNFYDPRFPFQSRQKDADAACENLRRVARVVKIKEQDDCHFDRLSYQIVFKQE